MSDFRTLDDGDFAGKRVLVRVDLNVPVADGKVTDATRIERIAPTIAELSGKGAKVILLAHFGRPKGGPIARILAGADRRRGRRGARPAGRLCRGLRRRRGGKRRCGHGRMATSCSWKTPASTRARRRTIRTSPSALAANRRHLRQRRLLRRAPRACLDRGAGASAAGLCRPHHAGRARGAGKGRSATRPRRSSPSSAAPRCRPRSTCLMNLVAQGRRAGHRRRHGQHLPRRARHRCRQVAVRARSGRDRQADHDRGGRSRLRHHPAGRRRRRARNSRRARASETVAIDARAGRCA